MQLYDNVDGHADESRPIRLRTLTFVQSLIEEHPEYSALELLGIIHLAAGEAFSHVSIQRRLADR